MKTKCVIIDDEPLAIELMESHITRIEQLEVSATFKNAVSALEFLKTSHADLLFLDIQMPLLSGTDFLKSANITPKVIFTTAYREYALEGYELNAIDYLLKPITFNRFFKAVDKYFQFSFSPAGSSLSAAEKQEAGDSTGIFVKADKKNVKINFADILYIESIKDYIKINTEQGTIIIKEKISAFAKRLPAQSFLRIHRSYIVNTKKITAFTHYDIEIGDLEIPLGGIYKNHVLNSLKS